MNLKARAIIKSLQYYLKESTMLLTASFAVNLLIN